LEPNSLWNSISDFPNLAFKKQVNGMGKRIHGGLGLAFFEK
jgi:hypothetical protein